VSQDIAYAGCASIRTYAHVKGQVYGRTAPAHITEVCPLKLASLQAMQLHAQQLTGGGDGGGGGGTVAERTTVGGGGGGTGAGGGGTGAGALL
jgi:hypothetical protein